LARLVRRLLVRQQVPGLGVGRLGLLEPQESIAQDRRLARMALEPLREPKPKLSELPALMRPIFAEDQQDKFEHLPNLEDS
jgi:hypothetical protein